MSGSAFDGHEDAILDAIGDGEPLGAIAARYERTKGPLLTWLIATDERAKRYARAREVQAHRFASEIVEIADDGSLAPDDRRVRVDARKWVAQRMCRSAYGDYVKQDTDVTHHVATAEEELVRKLGLGAAALARLRRPAESE